MSEPIEGRIQALLREGASGAAVDDLLAEGYAYGLLLDRERLAVDRTIEELLERLEEPEAARSLRRAWVRRRTLDEERLKLRDLLQQLRQSQATAAARRPTGEPPG